METGYTVHYGATIAVLVGMGICNYFVCKLVERFIENIYRKTKTLETYYLEKQKDEKRVKS